VRVLVAGEGPNWKIRAVLDRLHQVYGLAEIIHGGRSGLDQTAAAWVAEQNLKSQAFPVEWNALVPPSWGSSAQRRRDLLMLAAKPDLVLLFGAWPVGLTVVHRAARAGVPIGVVDDGSSEIRTMGRGWGPLARRLVARRPGLVEAAPPIEEVTSGIIEGAVVAFVRQVGS
jgi:hypothetical protein